MDKLFVLAIGGTGSRVLKALTMLLASGVTTRNQFEIVPVIIDPHASNEDLQRTQKILGQYQAIRRAHIDVEGNQGFFHHKITTLDELDENNILDSSFTFTLQDVTQRKFKDYINFSGLDPVNKDLTDLLFSGISRNSLGNEVNLLDVEMDIGFVGNPNIGSVVLNQFKDSPEFKVIANNFGSNDRIFVISSIFGGTGAAGFPTIVKNIRDANNNATQIQNSAHLSNSRIGAISVMPYFNLDNDIDSPIRKADFIAKTKSALSYYKDNLNQSINSLYYITDQHTGTPFENDPGDNGQKNPAHVVEMFSALAVMDFMNTDDALLTTNNGKVNGPVYKEFSIESNDELNLKLKDLTHITQKKISNALSAFTMLYKYKEERLHEVLGNQAWTMNNKLEIDDGFTNTTFFETHVTGFFKHYREWLEEMGKTVRSFSPFNLDADIHSFIHGYEGKKGGILNLFKSSIKYSHIDDLLSKNSRNEVYTNKESKFLSLFHETLTELLEENYSIK